MCMSGQCAGGSLQECASSHPHPLHLVRLQRPHSGRPCNAPHPRLHRERGTPCEVQCGATAHRHLARTVGTAWKQWGRGGREWCGQHGSTRVAQKFGAHGKMTSAHGRAQTKKGSCLTRDAASTRTPSLLREGLRPLAPAGRSTGFFRLNSSTGACSSVPPSRESDSEYRDLGLDLPHATSM